MVSCGRHTAITNADRCASSRLIRQQICDNFCSTFGEELTARLHLRGKCRSDLMRMRCEAKKSRSTELISQKPWAAHSKRTRLLPLYGMPCIIKAPRLLFEFQISFFTAPATHYKKSGLYHPSRSRLGSEKKGQIIQIARTRFCVRCDIHRQPWKLWRFLRCLDLGARAKVDDLKV